METSVIGPYGLWVAVLFLSNSVGLRLLKVGWSIILRHEAIVHFIWSYSHQPFEEIETAHHGLGNPMKRQSTIY